ncbi:MAG: hypothetical protein K6A23_06045 [Butyrivibrio sp.]|nr:hypothetical protein [Butyrivibrio sp.]
MYGIFMEIWVILKDYAGVGFLMVLFLASLIYLAITEKSQKKKILLVYVPAIIFVFFLIPITRMVFVAAFDEGVTYYRILWMIPMGMIIAYSACKLFADHRRVGLMLSSLIIIASGSLVYNSENITKAENAYHLPQNVVDICNVIIPEGETNKERAAFPASLVHYVRQYNTNILMPYGREMVVTQWDYYNAVYEAMEKAETVCCEDLLVATRETKCKYIVIHETRAIDGDLTEYGLELLATIDGYQIFFDSAVEY